nr:aminopeptidase [Saprospiraceae bacterium]
MQTTEQKYADLLLNYCLQLKEGESLFVSTTYEGQPLLKEVYKQAVEKGALVEVHIDFPGRQEIFMKYAAEKALDFPPVFTAKAMSDFDNYLVIKAPYNLRETSGLDPERLQRRQKAMREINENYFKRTASGEMKRSLCEYPTQASAQNAGMSLDDFSKFVFEACRLNEDDPTESWLEVRREQQKIVDFLNSKETIQYKGPNIDVTFNTKGRIWINSDGTANMPSGEVFTAPVEDKVDGYVKFSYPAIYMGEEVENVELWIEKGEIVKWDATRGKSFLDRIFEIPGTRRFGEVAVGTNYRIQKMTKNILFDEKIGGTIHMAIGQSYLQNGGKNQSTVHWDMITDMTKDSFIKADGEVIYKNGKFII